MNIDKIAALIKQKRKAKNLTQTELANTLGVTEKAISRWETGRGTPDISLLIPLSDALNISVLELLNGESVTNENETVIEIIKSKNKIIKLWKYFALFIINILLIISILVVVYSYIIAPKYENDSYKGMVTLLSESMSPNLKVKDTIIFDKKPIDEVKENDIIVYYFPNTSIKTVHRCVDIISKDDQILLTTKGDNNLEIDNYYVTKDNYLGIYDHKLAKFNKLFLSGNLRISTNKNDIFWFIIIIIISIVHLDVLQIINIYKNK